MPFLTEELWRNLAADRGDRPESVHLSDYPSALDGALDERLDDAMAAARAIVELGRRVRVDTKTKTRQPLEEAIVHYAGDHAAIEPLLPVVADELNVRRIEFAESAHELGGWRAKPDFKLLGPRLGGRVQEVAEALAEDDGTLAEALARGEPVTVVGVQLGPADVDLAQQVRKGWGVASEGGITVALDLELTPELRREGLARELVRLIQEARRAAHLDVSDRIALGVELPDEVNDALREHLSYVQAETLAVDVTPGSLEGGHRSEGTIDGASVAVSVRRS
jgi:isoleucyl-tRNA synthetase